MKIAALAFLVLVGMGPAMAAQQAASIDPFANPVTEARARALQRDLRCLVCEGESLDESNAPLAADLRLLIRQRIAAGQSDRQIEAYLVQRYGDFILMRPPLQPDTYALWLAPFLVLVGGGGVALLVIGSATRRSGRESRNIEQF